MPKKGKQFLLHMWQPSWSRMIQDLASVIILQADMIQDLTLVITFQADGLQYIQSVIH